MAPPRRALDDLAASRARLAEASARTEKLLHQSAELSSRAQQLEGGEAALRRVLPEEAAEEAAPPKRIIQGPADTREAERSAELSMAKQKQLAAEKYMRQQQHAQDANAKRRELQAEAEALKRWRAEMAARHRQQRVEASEAVAAFAASLPTEVADEIVPILPVVRPDQIQAEVDESEEEDDESGSDEESDDDESGSEEESSAEETTESPSRSPKGKKGGPSSPSPTKQRPVDISKIETAAAVRQRHLATYNEQEATLREREKRYRTELAEEKRRQSSSSEHTYQGELGPSTYKPSQMDAYKLGRGVAEDLVADLLDKIGDTNFTSGPTVPQLQKEYKNWRRSHRALEKRIRAQGGAVGDSTLLEESEEEEEGDEDDEEGGGDDEEEDDEEELGDLEEEEGVRFTAEMPNQIDAFTLGQLMEDVLESLLESEAQHAVSECLAERQLANALSTRIVLGSIARAAAGSKIAPVPEELPKMLTDMRTRSEGLHRHTNNLSVKWRGRRPRKPKHDDDSSSSSEDSDSDAENAGGVQTLHLEEAIDQPRSALLRSNYVQAEGAYWANAAVEQTFLPLKGASAGSECVDVHFSPNPERTLLACGTRGGGVVVWHLNHGPEVTMLRSLPAVRAEAPNGVVTIRWSHDGTELATCDHAGTTRVWSISAQTPALLALSAKRARTFKRQMQQLDANDALNAADGSNEDAQTLAREDASEAANALALEMDAEKRQWDESLGLPLGNARIGIGGGGGKGGNASSRPHVLMSLSYQQLYHPQLLDSTDEAEEALKAAAQSRQAAASAAAPGFSSQVVPTDKRGKGKGKKEEEAPAEAAPAPPPRSRGSFLFGGGRKKEAASGAPADAAKAMDAAAAGGGSPTKKGAKGAAAAAAAADARGSTKAVVAPPKPQHPEREWEALYPVFADFHPSFTLMGAQPSIMIAMKGGLIAKVNRPGAERVMHSQPLGTPKPLAAPDEIEAGLAELRAAARANGGGGDVAGMSKAEKAKLLQQQREAEAKAAKEAAKRSKKGGASAANAGPAGAFGGLPDRGEMGGEAVAAALGSEMVTREYFTGHTASIVFFGFIDNHSHMISLDASGLLLEWPYKQDHYSSYGWFKPEKMLQLGMTLRMSCLDPSQVKVHFPPPGLSVGSGADAVRGGRRRGRSKPPPSAGAGAGGDGEYSATYLRQSERYDHLFLSGLRAVHPWRVRREENGHVIRMYGEPKHDAHQSEVSCVTRDKHGTLLRHEANSFVHKRVKGTLATACMNPTASDMGVLIKFPDVPDGPQMRLQLLSLAKDGSGQPLRKWLPLKAIIPYTTELPPRLTIGPHMDIPAADYAYVLVDNVVRIYSLGSGCLVRTFRPLGGNVAIPLDCLSVSATGRYVAVGSSQQLPEQKSSGLWVYEIAPPQRGRDVSRSKLLKSRCGSQRHGAALPEQRVRESQFYLGTDRSGALNDHANVMEFMMRTAYAIVDIALKVAEGEADEEDEGDGSPGGGGAGGGGSSTEEEAESP